MAVAPMKTKPQTLYEQAFRESLTRQPLDGRMPKWLKSLKESALQRFESMGFPTRRWEAWRFVDMDPILSQQYVTFEPQQAPSLSAETVAPYLLDETRQARLVFVNGAFSPALSNVENLPEGVIVSDLAQALRQHEALVKRFVPANPAEEEDPFAALNLLLFENGPFVYIPRNTVLEQPVQVLMLTATDSDTPQAAYPRGMFIADENAQARFTLGFYGLRDEGGYFNNAVISLFAEKNARIEYDFVQSESLNGVQLISTRIVIREQAQVDVTAVSLGGRISRHHLRTELVGEEARCTLNGLSVLNGDSQVFDYVDVNHLVPGCTSEQLYKGILDGNAKSEFTGVISIRHGAKRTDASQLNRNLLLSDNARIFTRPQLRIDDDDVKCSHGATVGQLDEDQLFYLASRGVAPQTARSVLTYGFAEEIVEKISIPSVRSHLNTLINRNLNPGNEVQS
jgi:Fe-S cluster assembly protein SufD